MLELRPSCESCDADLPPDSPDARICSYECTFCASCVAEHLHGACPNCGGGFERRPIRPADRLAADPASTTRVYAPITAPDGTATHRGVDGAAPASDRNDP